MKKKLSILDKIKLNLGIKFIGRNKMIDEKIAKMKGLK